MIALKKYCTLSLCALALLGLHACNFSTADAGRGPIVLGDPNTIVTETDNKYLEDAVNDLADTEPETALPEDKDAFNNVATANQLAKQQSNDSIAAIKAQQEKEKADDEAKKKEAETQKQKEKERKRKKQEESKKDSKKKAQNNKNSKEKDKKKKR